MSLCPRTKSVTTLTGELGSRSAATTDHASQRRFAGERGVYQWLAVGCAATSARVTLGLLEHCLDVQLYG